MLVRPKLKGGYPDATIRQYVSRMAADGTSVIARVKDRHGYYLRTIRQQVAECPRHRVRRGATAKDIARGTREFTARDD
jgi:hypothetical protein